MQQFYGQYVKSVNVALVTWTERCLHGRVAHVPLQRMVAKAPHAHSDADCVLVVARSLSAVLRLDEVFAINVTRAFANASFPLVSKSLYEASLLPLAEGRIDHELSSPRGGWPEGSLLLPHACAGAIYVKPRSTDLSTIAMLVPGSCVLCTSSNHVRECRAWPTRKDHLWI